MKRAILSIIIAAIATSCAPGTWKPGNAQHFDRRKELKERKAATRSVHYAQKSN